MASTGSVRFDNVIAVKPKNPYLSWKEFMKERYGEALYSVPVDLGFGCPNRDPSGGGGCAFCAEDGGRARQITGVEDPVQQIERAVSFSRRRYGAKKFMLYVQAYTGTFSDFEQFSSQIRSLLKVRSFAALSIGTRPDCLPDDVLGFLRDLNRSVDVWVELGVQSTHDSTLKKMNRGHDWACSLAAIERVSAAGLNAAVHLILGLPGETMGDWQVSAERMAALPVAAVKLHNLHVVKGTLLAGEFDENSFGVLNEHRYAEGVIEVIRRLPSNIPVMRLTTDTPEESLIAPKWSMSKGEFSEFLVERMHFQGAVQGDLYYKEKRTDAGADSSGFEPFYSDDGSLTFWSGRFKEHFHSRVGAATEALEKFVKPAGLSERLSCGDVHLLDICYGLGYNALTACEVAESLKAGRLEVTAIEIDINVLRASAEMINPPAGSSLNWRAVNSALVNSGNWSEDYSSIRLLHGDARDQLPSADSGAYDVVFLDAFSTQRNAELWSVDFFRRIRALLSSDGVLLTYCSALPVRSGLLQAGFYVGETVPVGRRRGGTIAAVRRDRITRPVGDDELELIERTKRGMPYRDPDQVWSSRRILKEREAELKRIEG